MGIRVTLAIGGLVIAAIAGAALLLYGSGSDADRPVRPVGWKVERQLGPNSVRLSAPIEYCVREEPRFEEPVVEYQGDRAYIELRLTPEEEHEGPSGCFLNLPVLHPTIALERSLHELTLFDSSTDPPERRWPRQQ